MSHYQDTYRRRQMQRTITRQMSFDLTKLLVTEDWFSDISPQTMRRLLNIVSVTGKCGMFVYIKQYCVFMACSLHSDLLVCKLNLTNQSMC